MEPAEPSLPAEANRPQMSLSGRLVNVYATPGEVFEQVREQPPAHGNWLVPVLILALSGIVSVWVLLSQPAIIQNIREAKEKALEQQMSTVPPAQRQMVKTWADMFSSPTILKVAGTFGAVFGSFIKLFVVALLLWALGQIFFRADFSYLKAMEVAGLTGMIPALGKIVAMLTVLVTGNMAATFSPAIFFPKAEPTNPTYLMLSAINIFTLWYLGVLAVALGKLTRRSALLPALCFYGVWALWHMATITLSLMVQHLKA